MKFNILNQFAIDKIGVEERVARFSSRSIKSKSKNTNAKLTKWSINFTVSQKKRLLSWNSLEQRINNFSMEGKNDGFC